MGPVGDFLEKGFVDFMGNEKTYSSASLWF